ncbi:TRAP transporter permease [Paenibacillus sambharensis]|uniref:TRAP transporter permease n=1 Tax=Paenibacillus sambharensis TaxID=1803190 RepID=A0A2W1LMG0_9BACL|nr:TRAP transporter permease [Paenibacillus sambharensis]PZD96162.1 TRAP transporter permease [Paenibacillus sambharensis]
MNTMNKRLMLWTGMVLCVLLSVYHFYTAGFGYFPGVGTRSHLVIHLAAGLCLVYLLYPTSSRHSWSLWLDTALAIASAAVGLYLFMNLQSSSIISARMDSLDYAAAVLLVLLLLEATRRVVGLPLVIIAAVFIAYFFLGEYLVYPFKHSRAELERFFYEMSFTTSGIFGTPLSVSANYVFIFILFGAVLEATGAGRMFIDLALRAFGRYKGGPAKAAVVASGMLGSISGSSTANAVTTGTFTIPLMKKVGFKPHVAGGIEVAASSSGQLLPPIMGAAAFLMIEYTGHSYAEIIRSAFIPAILSYIAILVMVHFEASRGGILGLKKEELASGRRTLLRQGYLIVPVIVLVWLLAEGKTVGNAAFYATVILLVIAYFAHQFRSRLPVGLMLAGALAAGAYALHWLLGWQMEITAMIVIGSVVALLFALVQKRAGSWADPVRFGYKELLAGLELAARNALSVIVACATAGILIGVVNLTGFSSKLPQLIISFSEDIAGLVPPFAAAYTGEIQLYAALVLTVVACLILGLGLPTTATYVILAAMIAPALIRLDMPVLSAHLFVLYYGILADDTPPINLPAYATAGIAKADPIRTGVQGFKFDSAALLLPFAFATNPNLLLLNPEAGIGIIALNILTALVGIIALASCIQGWLLERMNRLERLNALIAALVLIHGSWITDLIGVVLLLGLTGISFHRRKKSRTLDLH